MKNEYLVHYGVKGMKWGVRKDIELKTEPSSKNTTDNKTKKKRLSKKTKDMLKKAAIGIGIALVLYGTFKLADSGELLRLAKKGKALLNGTSDIEWKKNIELADKTLSKEDVFSKVVSRINPEYGQIGSKNNCKRCTFAYELSRRGFDVKATKTLQGTGQNLGGAFSASSPKKITTVGVLKKYSSNVMADIQSGKSKDEILKSANSFFAPLGADIPSIKTSTDGPSKASAIFSELKKMPNNSRGEFRIGWSVGGAHSMAWEIINNEPVIFDSQTAKMYTVGNKELDKLANIIKSARVLRLDNVELNTDFLSRWVTNA